MYVQMYNIYIYVHVCVHLYIYIDIYIYLFIHVYVFIYIYIIIYETYIYILRIVGNILSVYCHVMFGGCIAGRLVPQPMHRSCVHRRGAEPAAGVVSP